MLCYPPPPLSLSSPLLPKKMYKKRHDICKLGRNKTKKFSGCNEVSWCACLRVCVCEILFLLASLIGVAAIWECSFPMTTRKKHRDGEAIFSCHFILKQKNNFHSSILFSLYFHLIFVLPPPNFTL